MQTQASSSRLPPSGKSNRASKLRSSRQIMTAPPTPDNGYRTNRSFGGPSSSRNQKETEKSQGKGIGKANRDVLRSVRPLPGGLDVEKFVMARSFEIQALKSAMKTAAAAATTRAFQSLPRHLRRRAASHNPRRVPKRLRSKATAEIDSKSEVVKNQKKRARKREREMKKKGVSKTDIYRMRQRSKAWLETHIWHAKRMKMINIWGHRLAKSPTQKSHRPSIRAARSGCIIHDASYHSTLCLSGSRSDIITVLSKCTGGGSWAGAKYESGGIIGRTMGYRFAEWPGGMIGPVEVLWRPVQMEMGQGENGIADKKGKRKRTEEDDIAEEGEARQVPSLHRQLWLRFHPAMFDELYTSIEKSIKSHLTAQDSDATSGKSKTDQSMTLQDLRGDLNSFELMGPRAGRVLRSVLKLCKSESKAKQAAWASICSVQTPASIPSDLILSLLVHDPRLNFPPRKSRSPWSEAKEGMPGMDMHLEPSGELAESGIWDEKVRGELFKPKYKKSDLDKRRNALGLPGTRLHPTNQDNRIPIMLIHRAVQSDDRKSRFPPFHGLTLVVPAGWGMAFWQSLVFSGSLIGGLDERRTLLLEAGLPSFPAEYPFTKSGDEWWRIRAEEEEARWHRRPPAKRANYKSLGTSHPFLPNWAGLAGQEVAKCWLVDDRIMGYSQIVTLASAKDPQSLLVKFNDMHRDKRKLSVVKDGKVERCLDNAFVRVTLQPVERGAFKDMGTVYRGADELSAHIGDQIIGYILAGNYSISQGRSRALACVSLRSCIHIMRLGQPSDTSLLVKVRNRNDEGFRKAIMRFL